MSQWVGGSSGVTPVVQPMLVVCGSCVVVLLCEARSTVRHAHSRAYRNPMKV